MSRVRNPIIIASLIITLCLVCLAGSTLALFTENAGTIGIITTTGDVEVDIVDTSEKEESLVGKTLQFMTTAENSVVLFEPGATFRTQGFKVKNTGTVSINFRISINYGDDFTEEEIAEFERAFEVWISTDPQNPENNEPQDQFVGRLDAKGNGKYISENTYYLVIKMRETADNRFQGAEYSGIGITVYAVQGNVYA